MGRAPSYDASSHRMAFETWMATGSKAEAGRMSKASHQTIWRWCSADFACPFNCPFHDWPKIKADMQRANSARQELIDSGVYDPAQHELAMRQEITVKAPLRDGLTENRNKEDHPAMEIIRRDNQVIGEYEYLYALVYYRATGRALTPTQAAVISDDLEREIGEKVNYQALYEQGLELKNLEACIRSLVLLRNEIDKRQGKKESNGITMEQIETHKKITIPIETLAALRMDLLKVRKDSGSTEHE